MSAVLKILRLLCQLFISASTNIIKSEINLSRMKVLINKYLLTINFIIESQSFL